MIGRLVDHGSFASLGFNHGEILPMKLSELWNRIETAAPKTASMKMIAPSIESKVAGFLNNASEEEAQVKLLVWAQEEGLTLKHLKDFYNISQLFAKQNPGAVAATYVLDRNADKTAIHLLGESLDNTEENFMVEYSVVGYLSSDGPGPSRRKRYGFQAPGLQADKDQIIGHAIATAEGNIKGLPSKLLQTLLEESGGRAEVSILSTGPLTEKPIAMESDLYPSYIEETLESLERIGLSVVSMDPDISRDFAKFLHQRIAAFPKELTGQMIVDYVNEVVNADLRVESRIKVQHRFMTGLPLLTETDFRGCLFRVRTDKGMGDIAFYENEDGALHFIDPEKASHRADQATLDECATLQKWSPVELLQFEQSYADEARSGSNTKSRNSSARELEEHDPADDTDGLGIRDGYRIGIPTRRPRLGAPGSAPPKKSIDFLSCRFKLTED